ncbi:DUF1648 domain-containing protein [Lederbergia lenta]|uniref:Predicted membrane protein n=1 Tax=Lederbergia lenta TaxID=1467 RepID=A0A2X4YNF5_LEDLE|nr:DUF5808 domain-containing protein [Lederbergia lenta]MCM3112300.1 DUF5808 domain-containing protein [Lederbergia lenta]MEC2326520.1 DUF5808 domain-containing protein [Lederbergia lenta]SQI53235.1 Predicted membrane protein [Lederbergia lenta]
MMIYLMILLTFLPTVLIMAITPYITRRTESFGVSIPEEVYGTNELVELRKKYAIKTSVVGIILLAIILFAGQLFSENAWMTIFIIGIFLFIIGSFLIYYQNHKTMKKMKVASNWEQAKMVTTIIDTKFRNRKLIYSNGWFIIALFMTVVTIGLTVVYYDRIPDQIPMQYGINGEVTNWATKTYGSVFSMSLIQMFMLGMFVFLNAMIGSSRQQVDASNPEKSIKQNVIFRRRWSLFFIVTGSVLVLLFSVIQLSFIFPMDVQFLIYVSLIITGMIVIGAIILSIITGQGGSRLKTTTGKEGQMINRDEDQFWKLGIFYFNSADPAIWVEKRFGVGWTVNMAKPQAWIALLIILFIPILIALLT